MNSSWYYWEAAYQSMFGVTIISLIRHFRNAKGTGAEMCRAIVSGIVTRDTSVSYWPVWPLALSPITVPEVFAKLTRLSLYLAFKRRTKD